MSTIQTGGSSGATTNLDTSNFDTNLDASEDTVQKALDKLDDLSTGGGTGNVEFITPDSVGSVENSTTETDVLNWTVKANTLKDGEMILLDIVLTANNSGGNSSLTTKFYAGGNMVQIRYNAPLGYSGLVRGKLMIARNGNDLLAYLYQSYTESGIYLPLYSNLLLNLSYYTIRTISGIDFTSDLSMKITATLGNAYANTGIAVKTAEIKHVKLLTA